MSAAIVSRIGLPLSHVSASAIFSRFASMRSAILLSICARSATAVRPQASFAAWAASRAASMSDASERAISHTGWPVIGEMLSKYLPAFGAFKRPTTVSVPGGQRALRALFLGARGRPPVGVEQGSAKVERIAGDFTEERQRGRPARRQAAGQRIRFKSKLRVEFLRQVLHADVIRQADDLDRLDAVVGGGAQDALEQLLANAAPPIGLVD